MLEHRYIGFSVFDRCHVPGAGSIAPGVTLSSLGDLTPRPLMALIGAVIGSAARSASLESDYQSAHHCSVLRATLEAACFDSAYESWKDSAEEYYLPVLHYLRQPAEVLFSGVLDVETGGWRVSIRLRRRTWQIAQEPSLVEYYSLARQVVEADARTQLYMRLYYDFMRDMYADAAILRAWSLLESMSDFVETSKEERQQEGWMSRRVRDALAQLGVHRTDFSVSGMEDNYASAKQDTVSATYQRRNCLSHEGHCDSSNSRCNQRKYAAGACRESERLRDDLEWLLHCAVHGYVIRVARNRGFGLCVASVTSRRFHALDCVWASRILEENRRTFLNTLEARTSGYAPCAMCLPDVPHGKTVTFGSLEP